MRLIINMFIVSWGYGVTLNHEKGNSIELVKKRDNRTGSLWIDALKTMRYHRNMMNEYLCRNYLANEIVEAMRNQSIDKRLGKPVADVRLIKESMLEDPGSQKYKDWLSRSTTLEDIYRHYEGMSDGDLQGSQSAQIGDGEITGYALLGEKAVGHGVPDFGSGYGYHHFDHFDEDYDHEEKGVKLKEIFDLALTAIAFLAFGTFITESMIYGFGVQNQEAQMMIVSTMPGVNGISFKSNYDTPLQNSEERSIPAPMIQGDELNEIVKRVLSSIEALSIMNRDGGECLKRVLCDNNKYARTLTGTQKLWLPLWSFGTSWLAGRFAKTENYSQLENLKATIFGFGDANCLQLYGKCDKIRQHQRR